MGDKLNKFRCYVASLFCFYSPYLKKNPVSLVHILILIPSKLKRIKKNHYWRSKDARRVNSLTRTLSLTISLIPFLVPYGGGGWDDAGDELDNASSFLLLSLSIPIRDGN